MVQRWLAHVRRRREERIALQAEAWFEGLGFLLEASRTLLRPQDLPLDLIGIVHRVDWRLEHIVHSERVLKRALRGRAPHLTSQLQEATRQAYHLRNQMISYFIRRKAFQDAEKAGEPTAYLDRREMEEVLLAANRISRELAAQLDGIGPALREALIPIPKGGGPELGDPG